MLCKPRCSGTSVRPACAWRMFFANLRILFLPEFNLLFIFDAFSQQNATRMQYLLSAQWELTGAGDPRP